MAAEPFSGFLSRLRQVRSMKRWRRLVREVEASQRPLRDLSEKCLRERCHSLRYRSRCGASIASLIPQGFAAVREAARRTLGKEHFEEQLLGGMALAEGAVAEMATGEGKTLTATLPVALLAMRGKGLHVATANSYLARRDAEELRNLYELLGLSVGIVDSGMDPAERRAAYACDITYGVASEFGFDFLRDRLTLNQREAISHMASGRRSRNSQFGPVQRGRFCAIVDEADSILIDDARTPLILSAAAEPADSTIEASLRWARDYVERFCAGEHFIVDERRQSAELTESGCQLVRSLPKPALLDFVNWLDLEESVERALRAESFFVKNRDYLIHEGRIVLIDQNTGRPVGDRRLQDGIHQAIEVRHGLELTHDSSSSARVTIQNYFGGYHVLAGMTGTAANAAGEFRSVYHLATVTLPTHRPVRRRTLPPRYYASSEERWRGVVAETLDVHHSGRPVLIGTRSVAHSESLAQLLRNAGLNPPILNARNLAAEAAIVANAGQRDQVTVATNMAGRGTDIRLGAGVAEMGGLHVISSEYHESSRIDRQLEGRCGRQGDPGTFRQYASLDDELLRTSSSEQQIRRLKASRPADPERAPALARLFAHAQRVQERRRCRQRRALLYYESFHRKSQEEMGLDPYIEFTA